MPVPLPISTDKLDTLAKLTHLPYDADKLQDLDNIGYSQNGNDFTFNDKHGKPHTYRKIAEQNESTDAAKTDDGRNAVAFVELDSKGKPLVGPNGKTEVLTVLPAVNNPFSADVKHAYNEWQGTATTSFSPKFMDDFEIKVQEGLKANKIEPEKVTDIASGHSAMGTANAFEFATRHPNAQVVVLKGWDMQDALVGAAVREILAAGALKDENSFKEALTKNIENLQNRVIHMDGDSPENPPLVKNSFVVDGGGLRVKTFANLEASDIQKNNTPTASTADLVKYGMQNAEKFVLQQTENDLRIDGNFDGADKAVLEAAAKAMSGSGLQLVEMAKLSSNHHHGDVAQPTGKAK